MSENEIRQPKAFISHSSSDKDRFVRDFAQLLRVDFGIDAWVDEWEIGPGDSFVDRIFENGIADADAFLVVISENSVGSRWVKDELDAATVRRITKGALLIPVILDGLTKMNIPEQLHHLQWVRVDDQSTFRVEASAIARAIHGHEPEKPPLGPPPAYTTRNVRVPGLSPEDVEVLLTIGDQALDAYTGMAPDPTVVHEYLKTRGLTDESFLSAAQFLYERGLLRENPVGMGGNLRILWLSLSGIGMFLDLAGVDIENLEKALAIYVVNHPTEEHDYRELAVVLGAQPLAVGFIAESMHNRGLLRVRKNLGGGFRIGRPTETLRRLAH